MEFSILYAIQNLRCPALDSFFVALSNIAGSYGQIWLVLAAILLIFKKTRKCAFVILLSYGIVFLVGQYGIKDLIARPRPCHIDTAVNLIVSRPSSFSFPSTHSAWAFAAATSVFVCFKKCGIITAVAALIIAFSRLYLFLHFPTDVLFGAVLGIASAAAAAAVINAISRKLKRS